MSLTAQVAYIFIGDTQPDLGDSITSGGPQVGCFWLDTTTGTLKVCTSASPFVWQQLILESSGQIVLWNQPTAIPAGWVKCNGQNGTPNMVAPSALTVYIMKQ